ncbi:MAG: glutamate 5-kinase [Planctomycetes bacterium]|nr:glutamate 5-kinase [Planctomycetota bacterium]
MRKSMLGRTKRIVVKVGSALLAGGQRGLNRKFIGHLAEQFRAEKARGREIVLVSSGAIATGRNIMPDSLGSADDLPTKQALASIGQVELMHTYGRLFKRRGITTAQVLITREDFQERVRFTNAQNTLNRLIGIGAVPVINENDAVATEEIRFGENDFIAALVTLLVGADALVLLTDVEGFYNAPPDEGGSLVSIIERITAEHSAAAGGSRSGLGSGGMASKLMAAKMVTSAGSLAVIAKGRRRHIVNRVLAGEEVGTFFPPAGSKLKGKRRWLAFAGKAEGSIEVDAGAANAVHKGKKSLLPSGVTGVSGVFAAGDLVEISCAGARIARGISEMSSAEVLKTKGLHSRRAMEVLGRSTESEVVHRDNLVVLEGLL